METTEATVAVANVAGYPAESANVPPISGAMIELGAMRVLANPTYVGRSFSVPYDSVKAMPIVQKTVLANPARIKIKTKTRVSPPCQARRALSAPAAVPSSST